MFLFCRWPGAVVSWNDTEPILWPQASSVFWIWQLTANTLVTCWSFLCVFVVDLIPAIFFVQKKNRMCIWKQMILYYNSSSLMSSSTCALFKFCRIFTAFNWVLHHKEKWQMVEERFSLKNGVGKQRYKKLEGFIFRADDESWFNHIPEMFTELSTSCASLLELK